MKQKRIKWILTAVIAAGCLYFGTRWNMKEIKAEDVSRYTATFLDVFDTRTQIIGYGKSEEEFTAQVEKIKERLTYYHQLYDIYHNYDGINNIKTINDHAGISPVTVDKEIIRLLKLSKNMYEQTNGKVDITMGSVFSVWKDYREKGLADPEHAGLPEMQELEEAAEHTGFDHLIINEEDSTVSIDEPGMSLDVGSIGKGYAVQKTAEYASQIGMENILISAGGNVCAVGGKKDGSKWTVGIMNPDSGSPDIYSEKVEIEDLCVVTSGNYQRYYVADGVRYGHIINPDTLMPADDFASVTILAKDSGIADALSTAIFNMPLKEGVEFINEMNGVEAMWIMEDGRIQYSEHFKTYLSEK